MIPDVLCGRYSSISLPSSATAIESCPINGNDEKSDANHEMAMTNELHGHGSISTWHVEWQCERIKNGHINTTAIAYTRVRRILVLRARNHWIGQCYPRLAFVLDVGWLEYLSNRIRL